MKTATWTLSVFQRKVGRSITWSTLGLGRFNVTCRLKHAATGQQDLQNALGPRLAEAELGDLMLWRTQPAAWLEKVHLDLRLTAEGIHLSGLAPLVIETLSQPADAAGGDPSTVEIAYSPLRPQDFFILDPAQDLSRQANRFFAVAWREIDATVADGLLVRGHEKLLLVPVKVSWQGLGEDKKPGADRVGVGRRKKERVLAQLAEDLTGEIATDEAVLASLPTRPSPLEQRLLKALNGRPTSFVFIGPAGCGKSTLVRTLTARLLLDALFLEHGQAAVAPRVFRLSGRRLIAGMSYFGQWEQRCLDLLEECRELRSAGSRQWREFLPAGGERLPTILWVEDLAAWSQIGQSRESRRCLADVFLTPLRRGEILIFGEATPEAFALLEDEAPAFAAAFRRVPMSRPDNAGILSILLARSRQLEAEGDLGFHTSALRALIETVPAVYGEDAHPGQSCRLLDQVAKDAAGPGNVLFSQVHRLIAAETGMPRILLNDMELSLTSLRDHFGQRVLGQDEAVQVVCELLCTLKAGLSDPRRPHAVLLFSGPTGTGKTELAKALAAWLYGDEKRLLRFDMGEHADPDAVARLVGDRARPQGLLTEAVRAQPFAVLLFDEIEKADSGVLALLLQVFEDGRLTDALGQLADFRQCVVILTSNLGATPGARAGLGVDAGDARAAAAEAHQAIERFFTPELWNRIDRIVSFWPLAPEVARRIGEIELYRIFSRRGLAERGVFVRTDAAVLDRVLEQGFDTRSGARGVKRYLEREVVPALTEAIAEADPAAFLLLHLEAPRQGGFAVRVEPIAEAAPLPTDPEIDRLYELPPARLLAEVPAWLARLELLQQELRGSLEQEQAQQLRAWRERSAGADALHELDTLRGRLLDLRQQLEAELDRRQPDEGELREAALTFRLTRPSVRRREWSGKKRLRQNDPRALAASAFQPIAGEQMVALVTEILWLEYAGRSAAAGRGAAEGRGQITVELELLSEHRPRTGGRAASFSPSLQQELALLLLSDDLTLESFLADAPQGQGRAALDELLAERPRRLFLVVSGTLLAERLQSDVGSYVRVRADGNQEIVRVRLHPGADAAALLRSPPGAPPDPAGATASGSLLQLIHWEAPPEGEWTTCRVEDFALCVEDKRPARTLAEVLAPLRRRRQMAILARERG